MTTEAEISAGWTRAFETTCLGQLWMRAAARSTTTRCVTPHFHEISATMQKGLNPRTRNLSVLFEHYLRIAILNMNFGAQPGSL